MGDEQEAEPEDADESQRPVFKIDGKHEPTGDPLIDRGMKMTPRQLREAAADPDHPDHEAAKAATGHLAKKIGDSFSTAYGDHFRRIGENLAAALKPNHGNLFTAPPVKPLRPAVGPARRPVLHAPETPDPEGWKVDDTPQKTLEALLEVSERMSEMVRVSAEHRDVAVQQMTHFKGEAAAARRSARWMLWLTWLALIGTWVALGVALASR